MTAALIPTPVMQFLDADGNPLVGGKVYTYAAGTSTPLATYTDYGGATPNANPVILNSRGEASIWFGTAAYKLALYTSATVLIWTADNVSASTPVVYGTGVAAALAINVGTAGSILVNGGALVGTTLSASGLVTMSAAATVGTTLGVTGTTTAAAINASGVITSTAGSSAYGLFIKGGGTDDLIRFASGAAGTGGLIAATTYTQGALAKLTIDGSAITLGSGGAVSIPGTLGVTSTVEAGLTISRSTDATCGIYLNRSGGANSWAMYRYGSSASDKFAIGRPGASEDFTITTAGIVTMGAYGVGTATFSAAGVISSVSDERLKIKDGVIADPIPMMMALEPGYYFGKPEANMGDGRQLGFYAQNVRKAIGPEAAPDPEDQVSLDADGNEVSRKTRPWGYFDRSVLAVAIEALKVHEGRLAALQADFEAYKSSHP